MSPFRLGRRNESKLNKDAEPSRSPPEESPWQIPPEVSTTGEEISQDTNYIDHHRRYT